MATAYPSPFAETLSVALTGSARAVAATATLLTAAGQPITARLCS